jgi:cell division GTPase FtsZ
MRFRAWLTQHLGAPATAEPAARAEDWLRGRADLLLSAGMGGGDGTIGARPVAGG